MARPSEKCLSGEQCAGSFCKNGICSCLDGFVLRGHRCLRANQFTESAMIQAIPLAEMPNPHVKMIPHGHPGPEIVLNSRKILPINRETLPNDQLHETLARQREILLELEKQHQMRPPVKNPVINAIETQNILPQTTRKPIISVDKSQKVVSNLMPRSLQNKTSGNGGKFCWNITINLIF